MAAVRSRDTMPELAVRRLIHRLGYRFRLHRRDLPGTPDVVVARLGKIINVHGCFWHMHRCRHGLREPVIHAEYWRAKRSRNAERDRRNLKALRKLGWRVLTIWECQTRDPNRLAIKIEKFLSG